MTKRFFTVFRAGKFPQGEFPRSSIEAVANHYDPSFSEAPVTVDHAKSGPAFGWVDGARAVGDDLQVSFRDVAPELKEAVEAGRYRKISIELFRQLDGRAPYLKAVTLLGATPPQIKDLPAITFADGETDVYEFEMAPAPAEEAPASASKHAAPAAGDPAEREAGVGRVPRRAGQRRADRRDDGCRQLVLRDGGKGPELP